MPARPAHQEGADVRRSAEQRRVQQPEQPVIQRVAPRRVGRASARECRPRGPLPRRWAAWLAPRPCLAEHHEDVALVDGLGSPCSGSPSPCRPRSASTGISIFMDSRMTSVVARGDLVADLHLDLPHRPGDVRRHVRHTLLPPRAPRAPKLGKVRLPRAAYGFAWCSRKRVSSCPARKASEPEDAQVQRDVRLDALDAEALQRRDGALDGLAPAWRPRR